MDVREDSTVGVKTAELLRLNVSTLIDEQASVKVKDQQGSEVQFTIVARPAVQVVQKVVEVHRLSINSASGPEDRGDYTNAVPGQGCRHSRCVATPGVHVLGGTENSWS